MNTIMNNKTESEFDIVFAKVDKRIKAILKSSNIDLMTKCEIYHIARSIRDTRDKQALVRGSAVTRKQFTKSLYRAEKSVNLIVEKQINLQSVL